MAMATAVVLVLVLAPGPAPCSPQPAWASSSAYDPNELSYGLYWFGPDGANQKFVSGEANPFFDPTRPTLIFAHGWQPLLSGSIPDFQYAGDDTVAAWIADGWNTGIFVWSQFADELVVANAEAKIWTPLGPQGMRWRDWDSSARYGDAPAGTPSAGELFYNTYRVAMTEQAYSGGSIRIAGHSLGNQMAVRLTSLVNEGIEAGELPENLRPTRVALLDPYWSPAARSYLDGQSTGQAIRECIAQLLPAGTLFEWYWSSACTTPPLGDANDSLKPMMLYAAMDPLYATTDLEKHVAAQHLCFWSYAFDGPAPCTGAGCLGMTRLLSRMSDQQLADVMRSDYRWAQDGGQTTASPEDDTYHSSLQDDGATTVTSLQASVREQIAGRVITITATVSGTGRAAADGTLVSFATDLGSISPRSAVQDGIAVACVMSTAAGTAHISATTEGSGGPPQQGIVVTFRPAATPTRTATPSPTATVTSTPSVTPTVPASTPPWTLYLPMLRAASAGTPYAVKGLSLSRGRGPYVRAVAPIGESEAMLRRWTYSYVS
jgi:hypothetical protein